jgi:AcrR family transcriptional regulator
MGWSRQTKREGYHHGNLRQALIDAALALIAERGPQGFNLAELARELGVSPAAPYRHFRDRAAMLAEIAQRGFELFEAELTGAWDNGRPEPARAMVRCGRAYLHFARRQPALYAVMFESGLPMDSDAALLRASERSFGVLLTAAETLCATIPRERRPPPMMVALHVWSMAHGTASLFLAHASGPGRVLPMAPEDLLEAGLLVYLQSLSHQGHPP